MEITISGSASRVWDSGSGFAVQDLGFRIKGCGVY